MEITLYSTDCPKCKILKSKVDALHVPYKVCMDVDRMLSLGLTQAPVLEVDGKMMGFAEAVKWCNEQ